MTTTNPLSQDAAIPEDLLAGNIVWYSVNRECTADDFAAALDAEGLDKALAPDPPTRQDAFARACKELEGTVLQNLSNDPAVHEVRLMFRSISRKAPDRHVFAECVDGKGRKLYHEQVATVQPTGGGVKVSRVNDAATKLLFNPSGIIESAISRKMNEILRYPHGNAYRRVIRNAVLGDLGGIKVRDSGSVYFVPKAYTEDLLKWQGVAEMVGNIHLVPLPNTSDQLEMVRAAFQTSINEETQGLLEEINAGAGKRRFNNIVERYQDLKSRAVEYTALTKAQSNIANLELKALEEAIGKALTFSK